MATTSKNTADNATPQGSNEAAPKENRQTNGTQAKTHKVSASTEATAIERYEPAPLPANRPLAARSLDLIQDSSLPGNRPIAVAHLDIVDTDTLPNHRPIIHSGLDIVNEDTIMGHRPVIRRGLPLTPSPDLPNGRPIATHQIYDSEELMGYID